MEDFKTKEEQLAYLYGKEDMLIAFQPSIDKLKKKADRLKELMKENPMDMLGKEDEKEDENTTK